MTIKNNKLRIYGRYGSYLSLTLITFWLSLLAMIPPPSKLNSGIVIIKKSDWATVSWAFLYSELKRLIKGKWDFKESPILLWLVDSSFHCSSVGTKICIKKSKNFVQKLPTKSARFFILFTVSSKKFFIPSIILLQRLLTVELIFVTIFFKPDKAPVIGLVISEASVLILLKISPTMLKIPLILALSVSSESPLFVSGLT